MPVHPPNCVMTIASPKNCELILFFVAPRAFLVPISRVRSVTLTSMIFINAMEAPSKVMIPMIKAPVVTIPRFSIKLRAILSLRMM